MFHPILDFKISEYFTFGEMTWTKDDNLREFNKARSVPFVFNMTVFCRVMLDLARYALGSALFISSGFRCEELNKQKGGATNSKHLEGLAADVYWPGITWDNAMEFGKKLVSMYKAADVLADVVVERRGEEVWVHIEHDENGPRLWTGIDREYKLQETP